MQFKFYDDRYDDGSWDETGTAFGYASKDDVGPVGTVGFRVDFDDKQAAEGWVDFTIPELRQMLAEAQELAEKESLGNCDCDGCNYAPLADGDELAQDFENRAAADEAPESDIERLLDRAEFAASFGNVEEAGVLIELAKARVALLG